MPDGSSASTDGGLAGEARVWLLRVRSMGFRAPAPRLRVDEPARPEETLTLDLPPRAQLLPPSGPSQLVNFAQHCAHFVFVA